MPNFFKKLTGSLRMPEEEDMLGEELEENATPQSQPEDYSSEEEDLTPDDDLDTDEPDETEEETAPVTTEDADEEETAPVTTEDAGEEDPKPQSVPDMPEQEVETTEEEGNSDTYTIAQLAQATTSKQVLKKTSPSSGAFSKLKGLNKKESEASLEPEGQLAIDVFETPTDIVIKSTIAGVNADDLDVGIEDNVVNIRGSRHREEKKEDVDYFYQECYWGTFSRSVILPVEVDTEKAQASLSNGVLTVRIPKIQREKEKKIKVIG